MQKFRTNFRNAKKENDNLTKKKVIPKQDSKPRTQSSQKHIKEKLSFNIKELEQVIKYREIKKSLLKEKIDDFENKKLNLFKKRNTQTKYGQHIRI